MLALAMGAPQAGAQNPSVQYVGTAGPENTLGPQSDADIWRAIRQGAPGTIATGAPEDAVMINAEGVWWSLLRTPEGPLVTYGAYVVPGLLAAILVFFLVRGRLRIDGGRAGASVDRFGLVQRVVHWCVAALFLLMALSGLILLFGRPFLIPLIGKPAFAVVATASMQAHNLFGPVFIAAILALFLSFVRGNLPVWRDLMWVVKGGGLFGGHVSAGRYNAGEKLWFWTAVIAGTVLSVSGILLSFPDALALRNTLHLSELAHAIAALVFIGFALGHIYLGTIGTEGTLEGMVNGAVDRNWAATHHDRWLAEMDEKAKADKR